MSVIATFTKARGRPGKSKLDNMAANLRSELEQAMISQILTAVDIMHEEPPPKADSRYERTHRYSSSWIPMYPRRQGDRLVAGIQGNAVDERGKNYTVWVGGDEAGFDQQAQHAETGWPLAAVALRGGRGSGSFQRGDDFVRKVLRAIQKSKG